MREILLSRGHVALVDDADFDWLSRSKWHCSNDGYAVSGVVVMHRLIMDAPDGMEVDHIDRNKLNNRRSNLRVCTHAENMRNIVKPKALKGEARFLLTVRITKSDLARLERLRALVNPYGNRESRAKVVSAALFIADEKLSKGGGK